MHKSMLVCLVIIAVAINTISARSYSPSYKPSNPLYPVGIQKGYDSYVAPAKPTILYAEQSNPSASAASASKQAGLNAGLYDQLVVPSYALLAGSVVNPTGGYANIAPAYGNAHY